MSKVVIATCSAILLLGFLAAWDMLKQLVAGSVGFNLLLLFIPIGIGLFLGRPWARTAAVCVFGLIYLLSAAMLIAAWFSGSATLELGTQVLRLSAFPAAFVVVAILCSITGFLHWLLFLPQFDEHLCSQRNRDLP